MRERYTTARRRCRGGVGGYVLDDIGGEDREVCARVYVWVNCQICVVGTVRSGPEPFESAICESVLVGLRIGEQWGGVWYRWMDGLEV